MDPSSPLHIENLPNEILIAIFSMIPCFKLAHVAPVSRRFYSLILPYLQKRLMDAILLPGHTLTLEAYHPADELVTPELTCDYRRTVYLDNRAPPADPSISDLWHLYAAYHPSVHKSNRRRANYRERYTIFPGRHTTIDIDIGPNAFHHVILEDDENFSQLCTKVTISKEFYQRDRSVNNTTQLSKKVVRLFRDWSVDMTTKKPEEGGLTDGERIIWLDNVHEVGVRFKKGVMPVVHPPMVYAPGERFEPEDQDDSTTYTLEYEELLVRAARILRSVEKCDTPAVPVEMSKKYWRLPPPYEMNPNP